jgi:hypothetical protein
MGIPTQKPSLTSIALGKRKLSFGSSKPRKEQSRVRAIWLSTSLVSMPNSTPRMPRPWHKGGPRGMLEKCLGQGLAINERKAYPGPLPQRHHGSN